MNTAFKVGLHTEKDRFFRIFEFTKDISYTCLISFFLAKRPRPRSARSGSPIRKRKLNPIDPLKKKSKAKLNNVYCFFKTIFRLALPAAFFNKPDNMQDRRPRFLQLISFSNLSMPENLVMTSPYSVYPYRLWGRVKKTSVGWGREFQTYVCCISFWRKKKTKQNKTKSKKKQKTFRGNQQGCWSKFVVFALEQNFRK